MGKYDVNAHVLGTCIKYCTNASPLGEDGTYVWRPNITGQIYNNLTSTTGLFYDAQYTSKTGTFSASEFYTSNFGRTPFDGAALNNLRSIGFNASNSNNIYTDNGSIHPLSLALNFIIKA